MNENMRPMAMNEDDRRAKGGMHKPHGRLIDADALLRQEQQAHEETNREGLDEWKLALYDAMHRYFRAMVTDAPTVVEAEGEVP